MQRWTTYLAGLATLTLASPALAGVVNGDFEAGGANWTVSAPANWTVSFPAAGGNPNGHCVIECPPVNSGGLGSIEQVFDCGTAFDGLNCVITFDYQLELLRDCDSASARIKVFLDGSLAHTSGTACFVGWSTLRFLRPCGQHTIRVALEIDPGNTPWRAQFDNVHAECDVVLPARPNAWGTVKRLFD